MRIRYLRYVLSLGLVVANVRAEDVVPIQKGEVAPFTGLLFPKDKAQEQANKLIELDFEKAMGLSKTRQIDMYKGLLEASEQQIEIWHSTSKELAKQVNSEKGRREWLIAGGFVVGASLTTLIAFAVNKAVSK